MRSSFNLLRAGLFDETADIYGIYDALRAEASVWKAPWGTYYVSSYRYAVDSLPNRALLHTPPILRGAAFTSRPAIRDWILYMEGEAHSIVRRSFQGSVNAISGDYFRAVVDDVVYQKMQ